MALFNKTNVPLSTPVGTTYNNYSGEIQKIMELALKTDRSNSGNISWTSTTSDLEYNTADSTWASVPNVQDKGETGLYNLLIYQYGNNRASGNSFILTADNYNDVIAAIQAAQSYISSLNSGTTVVPNATNAVNATTASRLSDSNVGNSTTPVYFGASGTPVACTAYAQANVGSANKLNLSAAVGNSSTPVYFNANGVPQACTMSDLSVGSATNATNATTASKLGSTTLGSATKPIYLNNGTATEGSTYAGGTAVTLNNSSKAASTASFYAPTSGGTSGQVLKSNGSSAPTWMNASDLRGSIAIGSTTGTLSVGRGGTGATSFTANSVIVSGNTTTAALTTKAMASANTANAIVTRDSSGNFSAGTITATLNGNASTATSATSATKATQDGNGNTISTTYAIARSGTDAPASTLGKVGDIYIQYEA